MNSLALGLVLCLILDQGSVAKRMTDRQADGFVGPVKKVFVEWSPIEGVSYVKPGTRCRVRTSIYDEGGRLVQQSLYSGQCGADESRDVYTYGSDGSRMTRTEEVQGKDSPPPPPAINDRTYRETGPTKDLFRYNSEGRLVQNITVWPSGRVSYRTDFEYDAKGRQVQERSYGGDGKLSVTRLYHFQQDSRVPSAFEYIGSNGKVYEETSYTEYDFNRQGDWIKRKEIRDEPIYGSGSQILHRRSVAWEYRQIEYYS